MLAAVGFCRVSVTVLSVVNVVVWPWMVTSTVAWAVVPALVSVSEAVRVKVMVAFLDDVVAVVFRMTRVLLVVTVPSKPVVVICLAVKPVGRVKVMFPCSSSAVELRVSVILTELPGVRVVLSTVSEAVTCWAVVPASEMMVPVSLVTSMLPVTLLVAVSRAMFDS